MEQTICSYLYLNNECILPGVGRLSIINGDMHYDAANQRLVPGNPEIRFDEVDNNDESLIKYVAATENIAPEQAAQLIKNFTTRIKDMKEGEEMPLCDAGAFYRTSEENIAFRSKLDISIYRPSISAERVIHPEASHAILVGDQESDSVLMKEYFSEKEEASKKKWWIAALVIAVLSVGAILVHYNQHGSVGNAQSVTPAVSEPTWSAPN